MALRVLIVGGGAAGFFAAIRCAEEHPQTRVVLYESGGQVLSKVRISGGGRCNATHACFEPRELVKRYPRGSRELLGAFHRWGPRDTIAWFGTRGVELKTEADGRMFPVTDDSATIIDCLTRAAEAAGVRVYVRMGVRQTERRRHENLDTPLFDVTFSDGSAAEFDRVILATGGGRGSVGPEIAQNLGHTLVPPVPSLFTFHIDDARIRGLEGLAVTDTVTSIKGTKLSESGPLLVTHWGMSGPAILKLSAWGARVLAECDYRCTLVVGWTGTRSKAEVFSMLGSARAANSRKQVVTWNPFALPARLWERLVEAAGIPSGAVWTGVSNGLLQTLASQLTASEFVVEGKSLNKEEFVTCGGVSLKEIDFRNMESRVCPGLFLAGELLDIDGVTGGFNFQAAWTTGWIAGTSAGVENAPKTTQASDNCD